MNDADVGHDRLREHTGNITGLQRFFKSIRIVELNNLGGDRWVDRRTNVSPPSLSHSVVEGDKRLIDRTVITPVEDEDFRSSSDVASQANGKAIRVRRG
jgi:hypothetical protein